MKKILFLAGIITAHAAFAAEPLCTYTAKLSEQDKVNSSGASLIQGVNKTTAAAIIRQDRANYYVFNKRDPEDTDDCMFSDKGKRGLIDKLVGSSTINEKTIDDIANGTKTFKISVFQDRISIDQMPSSVSLQKPEAKAPVENKVLKEAAWCLGYSLQTARLYKDSEAVDTFTSITPRVEKKYTNLGGSYASFTSYNSEGKYMASRDLQESARGSMQADRRNQNNAKTCLNILRDFIK